jgi:hypothetical protein
MKVEEEAFERHFITSSLRHCVTSSLRHFVTSSLRHFITGAGAIVHPYNG